MECLEIKKSKAIKEQRLVWVCFCNEEPLSHCFFCILGQRKNNAVLGYLTEGYFYPKCETTNPLNQL